MTDAPLPPEPGQGEWEGRAQPPHISGFRIDRYHLAEAGTLDHRGRRYRLRLTDDDTWSIRGPSGEVIGTLIILIPQTGGGVPVYATRRPGSTRLEHQGTDWRSITAALVNETLEPPAR
ncbi:MAG TPA: hypothetical protein VFQ96_05045 [Microbacteriaceae bacterium]|nr:hypothetical protein [Microbacteriaceae bacterium]